MYSDTISRFFMPRGTSPLAIEAIDAAAAVHGGYVCMKRCKVVAIYFALETLVANDATAAVLEFNRRPTIASSSGEVAIGTLTIPDATAIGAVVYKRVTPVTFNPGEELSLELLTQGVDGSSVAGDGYYGFDIEEFPEEPANDSSMVESA